MKMNSFKKKIMASLLAVSLVVGMAVPAFAQTRAAAVAATGTITYGAPVAAKAAEASTLVEQGITLTAVTAGVAGDSITIALVDPSAASQPLGVSVSGNDITVNLATGGDSGITSTAAAVVAAINNDNDAKALVSASGVATDELTAKAKTNLDNGADAVLATTFTITDGSSEEKTFTYVSSSASTDEFVDIAGLTALINNMTCVNAEVDSTTIKITAATPGVAGNAVTLAVANPGASCAVSGANLTGGSDATQVSDVPSFVATSVARTKKAGTNEATITFTLSGAKASATFTVYDALVDGSVKSGFTAVLQSGDTDVKLTHGTDVPIGKYYVSIDDDGAGVAFEESARTEIEVTAWVANAEKVEAYNTAVADATALKTKYKVFDGSSAQNSGKADMFPTEYSVIASNVTTLEGAITNAGTAFTNAVDDAAIVAATTTITSAMSTFEAAKVAGTKTYTNDQALLDITAQEARVVGITVNDADEPSKVDNGVKYVNATTMSDYTTALDAAKNLTGDSFHATDTATKITALKGAVDTLLGEVSIGTKQPDVRPTPPPVYTPSYGGGSSNSTPTTTPSNDLSTIISNTDVSANTPKGTEVEVPSSISDPTFDTREIAVNAPEAKAFVDTAASSGFAFAKVFQMNLFDGTTKVTKVEDGKVKIALPFEGKAGYEYMVLRYETNGGITAMPALYKDGQITFTTNHFSLYAIAVKSADKNLFANTTVKPGTPDSGTTSVPQTSTCGLVKLF